MLPTAAMVGKITRVRPRDILVRRADRGARGIDGRIVDIGFDQRARQGFSLPLRRARADCRERGSRRKQPAQGARVAAQP